MQRKSICRDTKGTCRKSLEAEELRFVFKDADNGKRQASRIIEQGNVFHRCIEKLCFSAQLTGFCNRYGLDIGGQKLLQTGQVLRVDAGEHPEDTGCVGRSFSAEQEIISRYSEGLAEPCQYRDGKFLVPCSTSARKELDTSAASASFSRLYLNFLRQLPTEYGCRSPLRLFLP